ncbi:MULTISPECIES: I78 family peptidase inhibitor [Pseudomonas]|nr:MULTISPECIES: I78 family peptidase inhibitor [Pseudomonas]WRQ77096.1 I78 family peptidase inhibitor [Pseudomonas saxonica]
MTLIKLKTTALVGLVALGLGALEASAAETVAGKCHLEFALTKMMHPATPEFLEDIRNRSGSATVRVEKPGENYTQEFRDDRLRVIVDKNNIMQRYLCG